jgi:hypothetical protein
MNRACRRVTAGPAPRTMATWRNLAISGDHTARLWVLG